MNSWTTNVFAIMNILFLFACGRVALPSASELHYYGHDSRQGILVYETHVEIPMSKEDQSLDTDELMARYELIFDATIESQSTHLFSVFSNHTNPFDFTKFPGTPRGQEQIKIISKRKKSKNLIEVKYRYQDLVSFTSEFLNKRNLSAEVFINEKKLKAMPLSFYLPRMPGEDGFLIYEKGCPSGKASSRTGECIGEVNLCTDHHYHGFGDFWYFWNPDQPSDEKKDPASSSGCPIKKSDLIKINSFIVPLPSTSKEHPSLPDYDRLFTSADRSPSKTKSIYMTYVVGVNETYARNDEGTASFRKSFDVLRLGRAVLSLEKNPDCLDKRLSYDERPVDCMFTTGELKHLSDPSQEDFVMEEVQNPSDIKKYFSSISGLIEKTSSRRKFLKYQSSAGPDVYLKMLLIDPLEIESNLRELRSAMTKSDVFIYDGHSGLGGYFDIDLMFPPGVERPDPEKYQIFFFNGCSTFSYYNSSYFSLKATASDPLGFYNLDILTNSIGAYFSIRSANDTALIRSLSLGNRPSWPEIVDQIYASEPSVSALAQVNGDESNPRHAHQDGRCLRNFSYDPNTRLCVADPAYIERPVYWMDYFD